MSRNNSTVYLVDDDKSVLRSLTRLLRSEGWNIEGFSSASKILERAPLTGPGCILLDVKMPSMGGLELQKRMSEAGISLPVVFLSGNSDISMSVHAMKHGAVDFLVKPIEKDTLLDALNRAIDRFEIEQADKLEQDRFKSRLELLTKRERQVMEQVLLGHLNKQISASLDIAEKTVKVHRARFMEKMKVSSVAQLVKICLQNGLKFPPEVAD